MTVTQHARDPQWVQDSRAFAELVDILRAAPSNMSTFAIHEDAAALSKAARSLHRLAVAECNYELTPRQHARRHNLRRLADDIAARYQLSAHPSDPRGFGLYLRGAGLHGKYNSWGGPEHGWGIG